MRFSQKRAAVNFRFQGIFALARYFRRTVVIAAIAYPCAASSFPENSANRLRMLVAGERERWTLLPANDNSSAAAEYSCR